VKNALVLAGALLLALALFFVLRQDGGRRETAILPSSFAPVGEASPASPLELPAPAPDAGEGSRGSSARTSTVRPPSSASRRLSGTVLVQGGTSAEARIALFSRGELMSEGRTDARGTFGVTLPTPAEYVTLRIEADGFASLERDLGNQLEPGDLELGSLWLQRGTAIEGVVVGPSGSPVENALVRLTMRQGRPSEFAIGDRALTDPEGRFRFPAAPRGLVILTASAEGLGENSLEFQSVLGEEARIALQPARTLVVRAVARGGSPLAGVDVELRSQDPHLPPRKAATDGTGRVRFEALGAPVWSLRALARGYRPAGLEEADADGSEITLELRPWPSIVGRLVAPDDTPAPAGARVQALPRAAALRGDAPGGPGFAAGERVDAEGRFRIVDLRPGEYVVRAQANGFAATISAPVTVGEEAEVSLGDVVLQRGGALELELLVRGEPAPGIAAEVFSYAPPLNQAFAPLAAPPAQGATSDTAGKLVLAGLVPGNVWVILRGPDTVPEVAGPFSIRSGGTSGPITVQLEAGKRLRGRVVSPGGEPIPRARLRVSGTGASVPFLETDDAGRFESVPLPPGSYTIESFPVPGSEKATITSIEVRLEAGEEREVELRIDV